MNRFVQKSLLITAVLLLVAQVHAARFSMGDLDPSAPSANKDVVISGEIIRGDYQRLIAFIRTDPLLLARTFVLASPGGDLLEAIKIGGLLKAIYRPVVVNPAVGQCASACFFIYVAAVERTGGSYPAIGIHRPYFAPAYFSKLSLAEAEAKHKALLSEARHYLEEREVPQYLIEKMFSLSSDDIYWLTMKDIKNVGYRASWFEQLLIDRCKWNKELHEGYSLYGPKYARAAEAEAMFRRAGACSYEVTENEARANFSKIIQGK
jgi:ATP-dependent protease ClpP protease subunit